MTSPRDFSSCSNPSQRRSGVEVKDYKTSLVGLSVIHAGVAVPLGTETSNEAFQPLRLETIAHDGAYAISFGLDIPPATDRRGLRVVVDIEVRRGAIGVGCLCHDFSAFVDVEQVIPAGPRRKVYVAPGAPGTAKHLMLRNADHDGASVASVYGIEVLQVDPGQERQTTVQSSFWDAPIVGPEQFYKTGGDAGAARRALASSGAALGPDRQTLTFPLAVTHTSRVWEWERCTQDFLRNRYQRLGRLDGLPLFEELPSAQGYRSYSGRLTLFDLTIDNSGINLTATRCIDSEHKIQHACRMDDKIVISLQDYVIVLPDRLDVVGNDPEHHIKRIDDPWFADVQTVFPVDDMHCVVSASSPDALMVLDLKQRRVVRRWRVPSDRYGRNYDLTDHMSVHDHFIANDIQLAHLNCAFPDGRGGFWISTQAQGDIGHVSANSDYEVIASGFVGCHGIRYSHERDCLYFSDSCTGRLISIGADHIPRAIGFVDSRWLHDAQHLAGDIFVLCLGDKNAIVVLDTSTNTEVARFDMKARGENVQFVNPMGIRPAGLL